MAVKMNPVMVRRKLDELEREAAELVKAKASPEAIALNRKKASICRSWLKEAEEGNE